MPKCARISVSRSWSRWWPRAAYPRPVGDSTLQAPSSQPPPSSAVSPTAQQDLFDCAPHLHEGLSSSDLFVPQHHDPGADVGAKVLINTDDEDGAETAGCQLRCSVRGRSKEPAADHLCSVRSSCPVPEFDSTLALLGTWLSSSSHHDAFQQDDSCHHLDSSQRVESEIHSAFSATRHGVCGVNSLTSWR